VRRSWQRFSARFGLNARKKFKRTRFDFNEIGPGVVRNARETVLLAAVEPAAQARMLPIPLSPCNVVARLAIGLEKGLNALRSPLDQNAWLLA
jgi:hypothetical protein